MWDLRTILSHTQRYTATCVNNALEQRYIWPIIREGDNLELPSPSKKYVSTYSMSFCLLLYIFYIFYIRIYIHTHSVWLYIHFYNYCDCGTWLSCYEFWKHTNCSKHLHLWDSFSSLCPEVLMSRLAPYSITSFSPLQSLPKGWI